MDDYDNWTAEPVVQRSDGFKQSVQPPQYQARGAATQFSTSVYNVDTSAYPEGLLTDPQYGGNYVVFYINVNEESQLVRDGVAPTVGTVTPGQVDTLRGRNYSKGSFQAGAALIGGTTGIASNVGGRVTNQLEKTTLGRPGVNFSAGAKPVVENVIGGAIGAGAALTAISVLGGATRQYKRLRQTIALHLPIDLAVRYGMQWDETSLAGTDAILNTAENFGGSLADAIVAPFSDDVTAPAAVQYAATRGLNVPGIGEAISKSTGIASNPKKEQLFKQVDFRTFTFTYMFFPKSQKEAEHVQEIVKLFKLHMHPEYKQDSFNFAFIYPSEFDIYYYHNGRENLNLHRHTSCVLTDMSVMYSPQGVTTMLPGGMPSQINVTLTFKELGILTKENIQDGF